MKKFLKVLGAAALIAGFTPYKITKDEENGGWKAKALLWQATSAPGEDGENPNIQVTFGFNAPSVKEAEVDLFSDEITVDYNSSAEPVTQEDPLPVEEAAHEGIESEETEENAEETAEETVPEANEAENLEE